MPTSKKAEASGLDPQSRAFASWRLSSLYLQLDQAIDSGIDVLACQQAIEQAEAEYRHFLASCHFCQKPTIFTDEAFGLPFCWSCLQRDYHFWYRAQVYHHGDDAPTRAERFD
jgi:hypothetical protein